MGNNIDEVRKPINNSSYGSARRFPISWIFGIVAALTVAGLIAFLAVGFSSGTVEATDNSNDVRILPVNVAPANFVTSINQKRKYTGTIRAKQQAALGFELTGRVLSVVCDEGDVVTKDQLLATLDTRSLVANRATTEASLRQAEAALTELNAGPRQQTIDSMKAQLAEAESNLSLAEITLKRRTRLQGTSAISESEFDNAMFSYKAAKSRVDSISEQLNELLAGTRKEKIQAQAANVAQLKSSLDEIDIQIEKSSLFAPFAGKIVSRMVDPGSIATASSPVIKIVETHNLEAVIGVPFATSQTISEQDEFKISVGQWTHDAKLIAKIQELNLATRTQNLIFQLAPEASDYVIPGHLCQIEIETALNNSGFWVPSSSLTSGIRGLWSLMSVDPESSRAIRCDVEVVYTDGDMALVRGTITDGALVIVDGNHRVVEGQRVKPVTREAAEK